MPDGPPIPEFFLSLVRYHRRKLRGLVTAENRIHLANLLNAGEWETPLYHCRNNREMIDALARRAAVARLAAELVATLPEPPPSGDRLDALRVAGGFDLDDPDEP